MKISRAKGGASSQLLSADTKNFIAVLQLSILGLQGLMLLVMLFMGSRISAIANRKPTFAQLINGTTVYVSEQERNWRYPSVIKKTASDWAMLTFNWEGKVTGTDKPDEGVDVKDGKKVPLNTWFASVLLEPKFAETALVEISKLDGISESLSGKLRAVIIIQNMSEPRQIADGKWQVDMIATRMLMDRTDGKSAPIPFNRTFTIQATEIQTSPLGEDASVVEQKIYEMRSAGLQITNIEPFDPAS
jgi:hypothetical protein